jgi:pilus assembly protein CpaB
MRLYLFIFAAVIAAGGTGYYLFRELLVPDQTAVAPVIAEAAPLGVEIFVPAGDIPAGTILSLDALGSMELQEASVTEQMIRADDAGREVVNGSVARQILPKGVPIARSAIVQPGSRGFLAAVLPEGMRAISIPISETAGIAGLVLPGDRVDMILTYSVNGDLIDAERDIKASETVMRNLRVLALDQRLDHGSLKDKEGNPIAPPIASTATLQVTPQQAEMITLATQLGDLSLVLNSVQDGGSPEEMKARAENDRTSGVPEFLAPFLRTGPGSAVGRAMTLDSDVTSLLQRQAETETTLPKVALSSPVPVEDRTSRVQIVRGTSSNAVQIGALETGAELAAAAEAVSLNTAD